MTTVILDTDIGTDIDDSWALVHLLNSPELDVRLITTGTGDPTYRAGIVADLVTAAGRDDIPIALGLPTGGFALDRLRPLAASARAGGLHAYRGGVTDDAPQAIVDHVMESKDLVTILAIGPATNIAAALELEPAIIHNAQVIGMFGSIYSGFDGWEKDPQGPVPEYNVYHDVDACRAVFSAGWNVSIAPLDTCGFVMLKGSEYGAVRGSASPALRALMRNYDEWSRSRPQAVEHIDALTNGLHDPPNTPMYERNSTTLFDCVPVYMAYDESLLEMVTLPIALEDDGMMQIREGAPQIRVAIGWKDLDAFKRHLTGRLLAQNHTTTTPNHKRSRGPAPLPARRTDDPVSPQDA